MVLLITSFKYSLISETFIVEYKINSSFLIFPQAYLITAACMLLCYKSVYVYFALCYENRHFYSKYRITSRAHSNLEKLRINFITLSIIAYSFFGVSHQEIFRLCYGISSFFIAISYIKYLPFYSNYVNALKATSFAYVGIIAMIIEFGCISDNYYYSFSLTVFVSPFIFGLIFKYSFDKAREDQKDYETAVNIYEFEKSIRKLIINYNGDYETIISAFSKCYIEKDFGRSLQLVT